jgi:hypothetical protein
MIDQNAAQAAGDKFGSNLPGWDPCNSGSPALPRIRGRQGCSPKPTCYSDFAFRPVLPETPLAAGAPPIAAMAALHFAGNSDEPFPGMRMRES